MLTLVSSKDYAKIVNSPLTKFDSVEFNLLNSHKMDRVDFLIYNDGKNRFGLIMGVKDNVVKMPFSAPFGCFSLISADRKIMAYTHAVEELTQYYRDQHQEKIRITLPPTIYESDHLTKLYNALYLNKYQIAGCDLNYHYALKDFNENYEMSIDPKARQKLRASLKNDLTFRKTDDLESVYRVIKENRMAKGYPLWMSIEDIQNTGRVIDMDYFVVCSDHGILASALVYRVTPGTVQVVYWGNITGSDELKPMNFLAFKIFQYYKEQNIQIVDIGPSTEYSIPNYGLCDFKQGIGCVVTTKFTFEKALK